MKKTIAILVCVFTILASPLIAQDEVDHLALATTLAADGHFVRAKTALKSVDLENKELDLESYHLVSGLVDLNTQSWKGAITHFENLLKISQKSDAEKSPFYIYYAQALHGDSQYENALKAAEMVGVFANKDASLWLLKIDSYQKLKRTDDAWNAISSAVKHLPNDIRFQRMKVKFLLELGLFSSAADAASVLMSRKEATIEDALALGEGLRRGGALKRAIVFLENARLRFVEHDQTKLSALLAYCYAKSGNFNAAADLLAGVAEEDEKFRIEAAEMFLKAGNMTRAIYHNSLVLKQKAKLRQRVAILVELGHYEKIAALYPRLKRLKVLDDDALRYAVAYAQFQTSNFDEAMVTLKRIKDSTYFESATKLREVIIRCRKDEECSP